MKKYRKVRTRVTVRSIESITCDICGKMFKTGLESFETQEFTHIDFVGGYGSVFGDGNKVECDICQHCLKKMLKRNARVKAVE